MLSVRVGMDGRKQNRFFPATSDNRSGNFGGDTVVGRRRTVNNVEIHAEFQRTNTSKMTFRQSARTARKPRVPLFAARSVRAFVPSVERTFETARTVSSK